MPPATLALLGCVAFATAIVGVITGGNSLVTVPVMMMCGFAPRAAIATNMFAITFMTLAATMRFAREKLDGRGLLVPLGAITLVTSAIGARLTVALPERAVKLTIAVSLVIVIVFMAFKPSFGATPSEPSRTRRAFGFVAAAILGIYGGLYSGGYTTLLTVACVSLFGLPLLNSVGMTKAINFISSAAATVVFLNAGEVDLRSGAVLAACMAAGGWVGAHLAIKTGQRFVRAVFLVTVAALGLKVLYDVLH